MFIPLGLFGFRVRSPDHKYSSLFGLHLWEGRRLYLNQAQPHLGAGVFSVAPPSLPFYFHFYRVCPPFIGLPTDMATGTPLAI